MGTGREYTVAIIGGGIVGIATAMVLAEQFPVPVIVLEAEDHIASHQTGHNSGVIHSGLYYRPGSLKARNCVTGRKTLYQFCEEKSIPCQSCGKIVVATSQSEVPQLKELQRRGEANGLKGLKCLGPDEIREHEPQVCGIAGLFVPETGIVDYRKVAQAYADEFEKHGGEIKTGSRVIGFRRMPDRLVLETGTGDICCRYLINCAGLQSDRVARLCGLRPDLAIVPFRGDYYGLVPERKHLVRNLVYPVPDPAFPFLGVHFTRLINGGIEAGPNAVLSLKREGYYKYSFSFRDSLEIFSYCGFWRLAGKYCRTGISEMLTSFSRQRFAKALQKMMPEIRPEDIRPAGAGVRAQAVDRNGFLIDDFRLLQAERMIHVLNAPSPAATASISIARSIAELARKNFALKSITHLN